MADPSQRRGYLACLAVYHVGDYLKPKGERWARDVHVDMERALGAPFLTLQRMANAVKHREKTGKGGAILTVGGRQIARGPGEFLVTLYWACAEVLRAYVTAYPLRFAGCDLTAL